MPEVKHTLPTLEVIKLIVILLTVGLLWLIRDVIGLVFTAIILASAFDPMVDWLQRRRIPRGLGIVLIFILILSVLSGIIYMISGPIIEQVSALAANFPQYYKTIISAWNQFQAWGGAESVNLRSSITSFPLPQATTSLFGFITNLFGSILTFFLVMAMTFYLTVNEANMRTFIKSLAPERYSDFLMATMSHIQEKLGQWLRGWLLLSVIVFTMVYAGLSIMGIKYALVLALMAGAFEIIPFLGPILAAIPAIFLATQQSLGLAVMVVVLYVVIQQVENNFVVPKVMGKITGLNPIIVLVSVLVGLKISGVVGALLAVPVATALSVFLKNFSDFKASE